MALAGTEEKSELASWRQPRVPVVRGRGSDAALLVLVRLSTPRCVTHRCSCLEGAAPPRIVGFHEAQALFARRDRKRPPQPRPRPPFSSVRISPIDAGIRSDLDAALELVRPLPDGLPDVYALSTEINSSRVEGIQPLTPLHG